MDDTYKKIKYLHENNIKKKKKKIKNKNTYKKWYYILKLF